MNNERDASCAPRQAVIYCRVLSVKQTTAGDGLKSQETRCREFARLKGHDVVGVFQDDVSGRLTDRPGMTSMLAFIRQRRARGVVVIIDDVSRLARGLEAHLGLRAAIAKAGGTLESPSIEFGEDPDSLLVENLLASVSQHQRQKNGEQTKNRMRSRVLNGYFVFQAPVGFKYQRVAGRGKMLVRDEPIATVIQEALESYASARFDTQADVMRFLQDHPLFPKDARGIVRHQRVAILLQNAVYAGYVEAPSWGVPMRKGQHEGLISFETRQRIQDRLKGIGRAPHRKNLNIDFPLRGHVACDDCGSVLTACWSKGSNRLYPYYLCPTKGCPSYRKSIRREEIEGAFEALLTELTPSEALFDLARGMFKDLWDHRLAQSQAQAKALSAHKAKITQQVDQFLARIVDSQMPSIISAYEDKVRRLESEKLAIDEKLAALTRPGITCGKTFEDSLRTTLGFLANPSKRWHSGCLACRQTVLRLVFPGRGRYRRGEGFRTTNLPLPFNHLSPKSPWKTSMAHPTG